MAVVISVACNRGGSGDSNDSPGSGRTEPAPSADARAASLVEVTWAPVTFAEAGVRLDMVADVPPARIDQIGERYVRPGETDDEPDTFTLVQRAPPLFLRVVAGARGTLAVWRQPSQLGEVVEVEPMTRVIACGYPATRQVAHRRVARRYIHSNLGVTRTPARDQTSVAVAMTHTRRPIRIEWNIETPKRSWYRAQEAHFFSSLRCE